MDNASKNAKDMIGSLQMKYNCGRQAAITNELGLFKIMSIFKYTQIIFEYYEYNTL